MNKVKENREENMTMFPEGGVQRRRDRRTAETGRLGNQVFDHTADSAATLALREAVEKTHYCSPAVASESNTGSSVSSGPLTSISGLET